MHACEPCQANSGEFQPTERNALITLRSKQKAPDLLHGFRDKFTAGSNIDIDDTAQNRKHCPPVPSCGAVHLIYCVTVIHSCDIQEGNPMVAWEHRVHSGKTNLTRKHSARLLFPHFLSSSYTVREAGPFNPLRGGEHHADADCIKVRGDQKAQLRRQGEIAWPVD